MKPGTFVKLPDGRIGTVVYHGLDGYGIQWGEIKVDVEEILKGNAQFGPEIPAPYKWHPEAMLRDAYPSAEIECVGDDYEILQERN